MNFVQSDGRKCLHWLGKKKKRVLVMHHDVRSRWFARLAVSNTLAVFWYRIAGCLPITLPCQPIRMIDIVQMFVPAIVFNASKKYLSGKLNFFQVTLLLLMFIHCVLISFS